MTDQSYARPWWDLRAAWIVWWRVRGTVVVDFQSYRPSPWWSWRAVVTTTRMWWKLGHGRHLAS